MTPMILCALLAAVLYGIGAAFEQHQAADAPDSSAGRPRLIGLLVRQPAWLLGIAAQVGGFAAHAAALRSGPLTTVQMVVAAELIVSVAIVRVRSGRPLPRTAWAAGAAVVAGIVAFLALTSHGSAGDGGQDHGQAVAWLGAAGFGAATAGAAAIAVAVVGLSATGRRRALLLGVAAGLADACVAVTTAALSREFGHGIAAIAGSWPVYALVAGGLCSLLLTQTAYQAGRPMVTLPVIAAVAPMASVVIGIGFLGETAHLGAGRTIAAGIVAAGTGAALVILARSAPAGGTARVRPAYWSSATGRAGATAIPAPLSDTRRSPLNGWSVAGVTLAAVEELPHRGDYLLSAPRHERDQVPAADEQTTRAWDAGLHLPGHRGWGALLTGSRPGCLPRSPTARPPATRSRAASPTPPDPGRR
jgi:hypothetical protein